MSSFPDRFPHYAWTTALSAHSDFVGSSVLLAEWPGPFACHCGNTGVERTPNKSQHTKLTLEKKILPPPLLPGFELATFRSRFQRSTNKLFKILPDLTHAVKHQQQQTVLSSMRRLQKILIFFCPLQVLNTDDQDEVNFLRSRGSHYTWPDVRDTAWVAEEQIRHVLDNPQITMRDHYIFE